MTYIDPTTTNTTALTEAMAHEIGHTFGLADCSTCAAGTSVMTDANGANDTTSGRVGPSNADMQAADCDNGYTQNTCFVSDTNNPACSSGGGGGGGGCTLVTCGVAQYCPGSPCGNGGTQYCCVDSGGTHPCCTNGSPIIIDTKNEGFHLTGLTEGVSFPNRTGEAPNSISWTDKTYHNGWLALDRNGNGTIDSLSELFGNYTPQPASTNPNGYLALAVFDDVKNGGNGNGVIDPEDAVYSSLRLWIDQNHDGISQASELFPLSVVGIFAIDLHYVNSPRTDRYGNQFRYRSNVINENLIANPRCYDVFLSEELN